MKALPILQRLILMTWLPAACMFPAQANTESDHLSAALRAHYRQVDTALAASSDARSLLARVTLHRALPVPRGLADAAPQAIDPAAMDEAARRAIDAADADPHVLVTLASSPVYGLSATDRQRAIERLRLLDPDNIVGTIIELELLGDAATDDRIDELLATAGGHATSTRLYYTETVRLLTDALGSVPFSPALLAALSAANDDDASLMGEEQVRVVIAAGVAMALALPSLEPISVACSPEKASRWSDRRHDACLRIMQLMAEHADTVLMRRLGMARWHALVAGTPAEAEVIMAKRSLLWQQAAVSQLDAELGVVAALVRGAHAWRSTAGEVEALLHRLDEAGVARVPPDGWEPDNLAQLLP